MITEREEKCVSGLIKREKHTCSSREQIYLLCPHMEVAQDVKFECTSDITVISHLDIPISVMPERPFLVSFISLPKQFKTNGKTTEKKKSTWGCYRGSSPGLSSYLPSKVQHSWPNLCWKNLGKHLPASQSTWNSTFPGETPTTCHCWAHFKCNILHAGVQE